MDDLNGFSAASVLSCQTGLLMRGGPPQPAKGAGKAKASAHICAFVLGYQFGLSKLAVKPSSCQAYMGGGLYLSKSSLSNVCAASIQVTKGPCRECLACPSLVCNRWGRSWVTCLRLRPLWTAWLAWARWVPQLVSDGLLRQCAVSASRQGMGMNDMGLGPGAMTMGKAVGRLAAANSLPCFLSLLVQGDPMMGKGDMGKGSKAPQMHADALVAGNLCNLPLGSSLALFAVVWWLLLLF